jgi:hypothetical protein
MGRTGVNKMKFILNDELYNRVSDEIQIGDVYPAKGGKTGTVYWVVIGVAGDWKDVKVLGIDKDGDIVQATAYSTHNIKDRPKVGFIRGLADLQFDIEPI